MVLLFSIPRALVDDLSLVSPGLGDPVPALVWTSQAPVLMCTDRHIYTD